jgi:hypothetical protein
MSSAQPSQYWIANLLSAYRGWAEGDGSENSYFSAESVDSSGTALSGDLLCKKNKTGSQMWSKYFYSATSYIRPNVRKLIWANSKLNFICTFYNTAYNLAGWGSIAADGTPNAITRLIWPSANGFECYPYDMAIDSSANIWLTTTGRTTAGATTGAITKISGSNNQILFSKVGDANNTIYKTVVDSNGYIWLGCYSATLTNTSANTGNWFFTKIDGSGNVQGSKGLSGNFTSIESMAADSSGNIYLLGNQTTSSNNNYIALIKIDTTYNIAWQRQIQGDLVGGYRASSPGSIAIDSNNDIYITGNGVLSPGVNAGLIAKYNSSGVLQWKNTISVSANSIDIRPNALSIKNSSILLTLSTLDFAENNIEQIIALPKDGTKTGFNYPITVGGNTINIAYSAGGFTDVANSLSLVAYSFSPTSITLVASNETSYSLQTATPTITTKNI